MKLRVVIADDEPLARARMRRLLTAERDVEIAAECADGREAVDAIRRCAPDVAFLDIEMPELGGFGIVAELRSEALPAIVFVTAYDSHAIRAFEEQALDYILKPVEAERLHVSVERARAQVARGEERLVIASRGRVKFISVDDITHIESAGNYARVHAKGERHLIRRTLSDLAARLDSRRFVRIHRGVIVNVTAVSELRPLGAGDAVVVLRNGAELPLSRSYRAALRGLVG